MVNKEAATDAPISTTECLNQLIALLYLFNNALKYSQVLLSFLFQEENKKILLSIVTDENR